MFEIKIKIKAVSQEDANLLQTRLQKFCDNFSAKELLKLSKSMIDKVNTIKTLFC